MKFFNPIEFSKADRSLWVLFAVNLYPILGVLAFGWNYFNVVILYIIETFIIGLYNIPKMIIAKGDMPQNIPPEDKIVEQGKSFARGCAKIILIPFFFVHFNLFVAGQTIFVIVMSTEMIDLDAASVLFFNFEFILNVLLIFGVHGYFFFFNFIGKKEYLKISEHTLMIQPYKRIFIQQFTVILGTIIIMATRAPIFFLVALILFKLMFDLMTHFKIHYLDFENNKQE